MKRPYWFALLAIVAAVAGGCGRSETEATVDSAPAFTEPVQAQPRLATTRLWLGPEQLTTEMAVTTRQIITGMMFRTNILENEGMIFVLGTPQPAHFWMKNCFVPLSVAYIDPDGAILEIHDLQPHNTNTVDSASRNVAFALETAQGWFTRHNIREGVRVRTDRGSLDQMFSRNR